MDKHKEKWVEDILQSAGNIQPAEANPYLATRIEARLQWLKEENLKIKVPLKWVWVSCLALSVLLTLNILTWRNSGARPPSNGLQQLVREFGWDHTSSYSLNYSKE